MFISYLISQNSELQKMFENSSTPEVAKRAKEFKEKLNGSSGVSNKTISSTAKKSEQVSKVITCSNATPVKDEKKSNVVNSNTTKSTIKKSEAKVISKVPIEKVNHEPVVAVTMQNRVDNKFNDFINTLKGMNLNFTQPVRMNTGLYELNIVYPNNQYRLINVDIDGLLYDDQFKFFDGHINAGDEYTKPCYLLPNIVLPNPNPISVQLFELNKILDLQTLKIKEPAERTIAFEQANKALSIMKEEIVKESSLYRFAFVRYESKDEFSLVSSRKNLASRLDPNSKLNVNKEIWINVKDKEVKITTKKY